MNCKPFALFIFFSIFSGSILLAQTSSPKYKILMDVAHGQRFWDDTVNTKEKDPAQLERIRYMTSEFQKTSSSVGGRLNYLKKEIKPEDLTDADLLFIHIPSAKYTPEEVRAITKYIQKGGALFLVMDADYWSTLAQTNVNDIVSPFGIQFGGDSPDTLSGGYTKAGLITPTPLKVTCHGARLVKGGIPFCFSNQSEEHPFGTYVQLKNGGKIVAMGDGMVSLYMTSWKGVNDYQCSEFMHDVFNWLLK